MMSFNLPGSIWQGFIFCLSTSQIISGCCFECLFLNDQPWTWPPTTPSPSRSVRDPTNGENGSRFSQTWWFQVFHAGCEALLVSAPQAWCWIVSISSRIFSFSTTFSNSWWSSPFSWGLSQFSQGSFPFPQESFPFPEDFLHFLQDLFCFLMDLLHFLSILHLHFLEDFLHLFSFLRVFSISWGFSPLPLGYFPSPEGFLCFL